MAGTVKKYIAVKTAIEIIPIALMIIDKPHNVYQN